MYNHSSDWFPGHTHFCNEEGTVKMKLRLSEPRVITFAIAVLLALLGIIGKISPTVPVLGEYAFVLVAAAFVLLALGNLFKGI